MSAQQLVKGQNGPITATDVVVSVQLTAPADLSTSPPALAFDSFPVEPVNPHSWRSR